MAFERKYSDEVRAASVDEVIRRRRAEPGNRSIIREVAEEHGVGYQSLRQWLARLDDGTYEFEDPDEQNSLGDARSRESLLARITELERTVETLEEDNRSLTRVIALFADQIRPPTPG